VYWGYKDLKSDRKQRIILNRVVEATYDYRFLLSRGYSYTQALDVVTRRYMLNSYEKLLLFRCVHSITYSYETLKKIVYVCPEVVKHDLLVIDFYNILLTVVALIERRDVFLCDDCLVRDLRGSKLRAGERVFLTESYNILARTLQQLQFFKEIIVIGDKNVSHSLEDIQAVTRVLSDRLREVRVSYILTSKPDATTIDFAKMENSVVASTDSVIIEKSHRILPLTTLVLNNMKIKPLLDFPQLLGLSCPECP
jgi:hypothetical protein